MRRVENASQSAGSAGSFNSYQFDFGLDTKGSSNAPLKDQKPSSGYGTPWSTPQVPKAPPSQSASSGWSGYQGGWSSQPKPSAAGASSLGFGSSATQTGWAGYQPMTPGLGGAKKVQVLGVPMTPGLGGAKNVQVLGGPKPAQTLGGAKAAQTLGGAKTAQTLGGGSMSMNSALRSDVSKLATAGIAGVAQSKGDVFGELFGTALNRSNVPMNKTPKPAFAMGNLDSSLPKNEVPMKPPAPIGNASRSERDPFPPVSTSSSGASYKDDIFGVPNGSSATSKGDPFGASSAASKGDPFGASSTATNGDPFGASAWNSSVPPQRAPVKPTPVADPFDVFTAKSAPSTNTARKQVDPLDSFMSQSSRSPAAVQDDGWGVFGDSGGGSSASNEPTTTELDGLPPPPIGVTAQAASDKGAEFYKNGQFPDAIKWLTWSIELMKSSPNSSLMVEVLTARVSCFKEIGEMKKAVADCSKAIEMKPTSTILIMIRANLYESMEKYKLGVADLKLVLKLDGDHRQARATLSRLERLIGK